MAERECTGWRKVRRRVVETRRRIGVACPRPSTDLPPGPTAASPGAGGFLLSLPAPRLDLPEPDRAASAAARPGLPLHGAGEGLAAQSNPVRQFGRRSNVTHGNTTSR